MDEEGGSREMQSRRPRRLLENLRTRLWEGRATRRLSAPSVCGQSATQTTRAKGQAPRQQNTHGTQRSGTRRSRRRQGGAQHASRHAPGGGGTRGGARALAPDVTDGHPPVPRASTRWVGGVGARAPGARRALSLSGSRPHTLCDHEAPCRNSPLSCGHRLRRRRSAMTCGDRRASAVKHGAACCCTLRRSVRPTAACDFGTRSRPKRTPGSWCSGRPPFSPAGRGSERVTS